MNLEQQYNRLTAPEKTKVQKGAKLVSDLLVQVGKQQAAKLASDAASKAIASQLKKG